MRKNICKLILSLGILSGPITWSASASGTFSANHSLFTVDNSFLFRQKQSAVQNHSPHFEVVKSIPDERDWSSYLQAITEKDLPVFFSSPTADKFLIKRRATIEETCQIMQVLVEFLQIKNNYGFIKNCCNEYQEEYKIKTGSSSFLSGIASSCNRMELAKDIVSFIHNKLQSNISHFFDEESEKNPVLSLDNSVLACFPCIEDVTDFEQIVASLHKGFCESIKRYCKRYIANYSVSKENNMLPCFFRSHPFSQPLTERAVGASLDAYDDMITALFEGMESNESDIAKLDLMNEAVLQALFSIDGYNARTAATALFANGLWRVCLDLLNSGNTKLTLQELMSKSLSASITMLLEKFSSINEFRNVLSNIDYAKDSWHKIERCKSRKSHITTMIMILMQSALDRFLNTAECDSQYQFKNKEFESGLRCNASNLPNFIVPTRNYSTDQAEFTYTMPHNDLNVLNGMLFHIDKNYIDSESVIVNSGFGIIGKTQEGLLRKKELKAIEKSLENFMNMIHFDFADTETTYLKFGEFIRRFSSLMMHLMNERRCKNT
ncbi:hypothetical protein FACS1894113_4570 [Alphaproteobacteria bacterium]|nr:hypothetical protein FACS1894113_4570 [Alphaproteobacteria bacterium]